MPTYIVFIHFGKAFDRVNRVRLSIIGSAIMANKGIPQRLIRAVQRLYIENKTVIEKEDRAQLPV